MSVLYIINKRKTIECRYAAASGEPHIILFVRDFISHCTILYRDRDFVFVIYSQSKDFNFYFDTREAADAAKSAICDFLENTDYTTIIIRDKS